LIVSENVLYSFKELKMAYPKTSNARERVLVGILNQLAG
jgi:hypothetical protein